GAGPAGEAGGVAAGAHPARRAGRRRHRGGPHRDGDAPHRLLGAHPALVLAGHHPAAARHGVERRHRCAKGAGELRLLLRRAPLRHVPGGPVVLVGLRRGGRGGAPVGDGGVRGAPPPGPAGAHLHQGGDPAHGKTLAEAAPAGVCCGGARRAALFPPGEERRAGAADLRGSVRGADGVPLRAPGRRKAPRPGAARNPPGPHPV
ncbi:MAG: Protein-methionine-sulfoxide reductase heme-binding subunit MsrQ, partial [uncultured Gemmatimonadetes bacterium]